MEVLGKEVPTSVIVVLLVISGLGATAGAATTGVIEGESTTDVNQALLVDESSSGFSGASGVFQVGDGRSSFVTGASVNQGDTYTIEVALDNEADSDISARLVIDNPRPLHVDASSSSGDIDVQRLGANEFILEVAGNTGSAGDVIELTVTAPNNVNPGFYTFETTIAPIDVGDEVRE